MLEGTTGLHVERKKLGGMYVEALSIGKYRKHSERNEDGFVATQDTFAVIDGSAPKLPIEFNGKSSAQFATDVLKEVFKTSGPDLNGPALVAVMTDRLNEALDEIGATAMISQTPEARPAALFTVARIHKGKLIVTAVGDVHCRINGQVVHDDRILSEDLMIEKRVAAMKDALSKQPNLSEEELRDIGRAAIEDDLKNQVKNYFNVSDDKLGLGIINGTEVPEKFVKTYEFNAVDVHTLEIFSDGYCEIPQEAEITSWEETFMTSEKDDPLRWEKYPAVKCSSPDQFSDDRTILIAKAK